MIRKRVAAIFVLCFLLLATVVLPVAASAYEGGSGITEGENNGVNAPTFDYAEDELDSPVVDVQVVEEATPLTWLGIAGVVLAVVAVGAFTVVYIMQDKKQKAQGKLRIGRWFIAGGVSLVFLAAGITGFCVNVGGEYNPYNFIGAAVSETVAPGTAGYTEELSLRKQLADFEQGTVYLPYDGTTNRSPHFWTKSEPSADYEQISLPEDKQNMYEYGNTEGMADDSNYWYVLPAADGSKNGVTEARFRLYVSTSAAYKDVRPYDKLRIRFRGQNPDSNSVNLSVYVETRLDKDNPVRTLVGTYNGNSGDLVDITLDLGVIPKESRQYVSHIAFCTSTQDIGSHVDGRSYQRNDIYSIEFYSTKQVSMTTTISNYQMESEYLGSVRYTLYGSYSPSGMYDSSDGKYKLWYGCSVPEAGASDVIWYMETVDPKLGWSEPVRLYIEDPEGKLNQPYNYGGDPTVVKVDGTFYMYFSALGPGWLGNRVYLATSADGINYTLYGEVVDCLPEEVQSPGGAYNYGAGGPSVLYKDGEFWLYYYTQAGAADSPDLDGVLLRKSTDGKTFGYPEQIVSTPNNVGGAIQPQGSIDVKWMEDLEIFVACDYDDYADNTPVLNGANVRIGISYDGVNFQWGDDAWQRPAQDFSSTITHNVGWIGDELGHGFETMFIVYGVNYMELYSSEGIAMMDERQLEWSRVKITAYIEE